jgi:hypothetical protein
MGSVKNFVQKKTKRGQKTRSRELHTGRAESSY